MFLCTFHDWSVSVLARSFFIKICHLSFRNFRIITFRIENPYNSLRQITNLPQRTTTGTSAATGPYCLENAVYSVVRRYPVRKPQPFLQRLVVEPAEFLYRFVTLGSAGDGEYRQYHYVGEKVLAPSLTRGSCSRTAVSYKLAISTWVGYGSITSAVVIYYILIHK